MRGRDVNIGKHVFFLGNWNQLILGLPEYEQLARVDISATKFIVTEINLERSDSIEIELQISDDTFHYFWVYEQELLSNVNLVPK